MDKPLSPRETSSPYHPPSPTSISSDLCEAGCWRLAPDTDKQCTRWGAGSVAFSNSDMGVVKGGGEGIPHPSHVNSRENLFGIKINYE